MENLSVCLSVSLSVCQSVCLSVGWSVGPSVCLSLPVSACQSAKAALSKPEEAMSPRRGERARGDWTNQAVEPECYRPTAYACSYVPECSTQQANQGPHGPIHSEFHSELVSPQTFLCCARLIIFPLGHHHWRLIY